VQQVERHVGRPGFKVTTSAGVIEAANVVAATGPFQRPSIPDIVPATAPLHQLHSCAYKNPGQLPEGAVLVVGAGASGAQIAEELQKAGKTVYLSVGEHYRPPRAYRGRDYCWWLGALGLWDEVKIQPKKNTWPLPSAATKAARPSTSAASRIKGSTWWASPNSGTQAS